MDAPGAELRLLIEILLAVLLLGYLVSGLDDLVFDVVYWGRRVLFGESHPPVKVSALAAVPEARIAIFLPAWRESSIIAEMLRFNAGVIRYGAFDFFVGTYPNDPETQEAVRSVTHVLDNVRLCVGEKPGPTTKADNLNTMLAEMERREAELESRYACIVLHDAEDVFHPLELKLLNYHLANGAPAMIQTPIYPVPVLPPQWTAGTYMDQFAEIQTKDLEVRGALGGFVPSAGVATAIRRDAIDLLRASGQTKGLAFNADSLTEDYELGLRLRLEGERGVFIRQRVVHDVGDARELTGARREEIVATWAEFPGTAKRALRQRTRWALGIVYQSREHCGWGRGFVNRWLLLHDRKAAWAYPLLLLGYLVLATVLVSNLVRSTIDPDLPSLLPDRGWIRLGMLIAACMMANRLLQRAIAVTRVYGSPLQGALAIVRQPWDNVLSLGAVFRALRQHRLAKRDGSAPVWDKTAHEVPSLVRVRPWFGETLLESDLVSLDQLRVGLQSQRKTGRRLGEELVALGFLSPPDLARALVLQAERAAAAGPVPMNATR